MLRQDVLFAERKFSEYNCITRSKEIAEMDYYASKRVSLHCERLLQPYTVQQAVLQPSNVQQAVLQPSTEQQAVFQPYTVQQAVLQPSTVQQTELQTYTVQRAVPQSYTVQQAVFQPYTVQQAVLQPSTIQQAVLQPSTVQQTELQTYTVQRAVPQSYTVQQAVFQPYTVQQAVLQPSIVQQAVLQPSTIQQAVLQPSTVQRTELQPSTAQQAVTQQNTGVAPSVGMATQYGWANRLLSDEQIQQFITSTVLPHHRTLTSPDQSKKTAKYVAPTAAQVSQRGVETGLQTTPITPAKFMEAKSSNKRFPPSYVTVRSEQQSPKTPRAEDRMAALAVVNSFLSDEQIKQFITSTVLPHHQALTNPKSKMSTNARQHRHDMINVGESSKRPVEQVPTHTSISPQGTKRGTVSGFQDTWGENGINNVLHSQGSASVSVPSVHSTVTRSNDPVQYTTLKVARTNSMETQSLTATSMPANDTLAYGVSANDMPAHHVSVNAVSANHVLANAVSAKGRSTNGVSAKNVSANGVTADHTSTNDKSASQQHQQSPISQTQSLSIVSHTKAKRSRKRKAKTEPKDKQTFVEGCSDLGSSPPSHLSRHVQTENADQDSSEGLQNSKKNERKISAVKNREKNCRKSRKSPKKRGKDLSSFDTPKKRRKVVSESKVAEVQQCPESQDNTDSDREISKDDDDFFNECIQDFFDKLMEAEVRCNAQPSSLLPFPDPMYIPSRNIIPCENYYIDLDLFL